MTDATIDPNLMPEITITVKQLEWLQSRGGRDLRDVFQTDDGVLYIYMSNCGKAEKVCLPFQLSPLEKEN